MAQNEAKDPPKRVQEAPKRPKKVIPNRRGGVPPVYPHPRGAIWDPKMAPKPIPKRSNIETKIEDETEATQDDLGAVLERSWVDLGPILGSILAKKYWKTYYFVKNRFFEHKSVRRRFRDQLGPKKAPKMTSQMGPRSTPKRTKIDIKILINFDANPKGR